MKSNWRVIREFHPTIAAPTMAWWVYRGERPFTGGQHTFFFKPEEEDDARTLADVLNQHEANR